MSLAEAHDVCFSRDTIVTFDRRVNIVDETECLHRLGLSKELRGHATTTLEIERARALLPEVFHEFATGEFHRSIRVWLTRTCLLSLIEMATTGSLKPLFETRTSSTEKSLPTAASVVFVPPSYFKVDGKIDPFCRKKKTEGMLPSD